MIRLLFCFILTLLILPLQSQTRQEADSIKNLLEDIYELDQSLRRQISSTPENERPALFQKINRSDSLNRIQVTAILNEFGWLSISEVGSRAATALFLVVQHADLALMKQYHPNLMKLAQKGEAQMTHACMMLDRILMNEGKKQRYGTQASSRLSEDGSFRIWPIEDPEKVNRLRKEAGFTNTIQENAARLGAVYDPNEPLPGKR